MEKMQTLVVVILGHVSTWRKNVVDLSMGSSGKGEGVGEAGSKGGRDGGRYYIGT